MPFDPNLQQRTLQLLQRLEHAGHYERTTAPSRTDAYHTYGCCPECDTDTGRPHTQNCELAALLRELAPEGEVSSATHSSPTTSTTD